MPTIQKSLHLEDHEFAGAAPLTRDSLVEMAKSVAGQGPADEVHIFVCDLAHFPGEEPSRRTVARIELRRTPERRWCLQYVSHPDQSQGLTAQVQPRMDDYEAYVMARQARGLLRPAHVDCAHELDEEGCGPYDLLCLKLGDQQPLVPDWRAFRALELAEARLARLA